jgi:uncharacterized membrane protein
MKLRPWLDQFRVLFLQGIAFLAPLIITVALLVWLGGVIEHAVGAVFRVLLPEGWYIPGMGLAAGILITLAVGLIANVFLVRMVVSYAERVIDRIPLVKSLFQGLKDISRLLARTDGEQQLGRPVVVQLDEARLIGFMMQEHARLPGDEETTDQVAVYLPMSYQVGGYTIYLDRAKVRPLPVGAEQTLRAVLTGGHLEARASAKTAPRKERKERPAVQDV